MWQDVEVTAVESNPEIAAEYLRRYPADNVVVEDAHGFLLRHHGEFDFVWSSPPCQSHSSLNRAQFGGRGSSRFPDLRLYEEIIFLKHFAAANWCVENVVPYYEPLIPAQRIGRHLFWANFHIFAEAIPMPPRFAKMQNTQAAEELANWLGIPRPAKSIFCGTHDPTQVVRNCVHPMLGLDVLNSLPVRATATGQQTRLEFAL